MMHTAFSSHIGTREYQQDYVLTGAGREGITFGILCDGMGGLADGEVASATAAQTLALALREMEPDCGIPAYLAEQADYINDVINALDTSGDAGTTLAVAVASADRLFWLSVGDSRIYVIRGDEIVAVTRGHTYALELDKQMKRGKISAEEAAADPRREALISHMGIPKLEMVDTNANAFILEDGDTVLLCSDGLYRSLTDADILEIINRHSDDLDECARVLPIFAFDKSSGSHDNTSVILMRYQKIHIEECEQ